MHEVHNELLDTIKCALGVSVAKVTRLTGGSTNAAFKVITTDGEAFLIKTQPQAADAFAAEARGLEEIAKARAIKVPAVCFFDERLLITEWIASGTRNPATFFEFGKNLARLHKYKASSWGFIQDNYCGQTRQMNVPPLRSDTRSWGEFFLEYRLRFQVRLAKDRGLGDRQLYDACDRLYEIADHIIGDDGESPSLLHGDLWGGNYVIDLKGDAVLIDPAVYYGHREADLAMTSLFGGFPDDFYRGYFDEYPLRVGWQQRQPLYQLYHLLNHLNLLGGGYYGQVLATIHNLLTTFKERSKS